MFVVVALHVLATVKRRPVEYCCVRCGPCIGTYTKFGLIFFWFFIVKNEKKILTFFFFFFDFVLLFSVPDIVGVRVPCTYWYCTSVYVGVCRCTLVYNDVACTCRCHMHGRRVRRHVVYVVHGAGSGYKYG